MSVACNGNVIGLDFGSDTLKVALVQPGKPLEIVSNFQSKRKTPTAITFYRGERMFGADATALQTRKPDLSFTKMHRMLGRDPSDTLVQEIREQYYPYEMYGNDTRHNSLCIKQDNTFYTPEELIAMMMQHAKDMTHNYGGKHIKDCVITVPSHYTQHQRRAMVAAAEIADLRVLSLIEENTAAALHYGIDRVFEEPHTIVYYNMGASTTQVSVVTYHSYKAKESGKNKTIGQFEVVGKGWDRSLGGFNFDIKLAELLADRFNDGWSKKKSYKEGDDVKKHILPMTKLRAQANKVKEVLSASLPLKDRALDMDLSSTDIPDSTVGAKVIKLAQNKTIKSLHVQRTTLVGETGSQNAVDDVKTSIESIPCQLLLVSVGYKSISFPGVPFDVNKYVVPNEHGRVLAKAPSAPQHADGGLRQITSTLNRMLGDDDQDESIHNETISGLYVVGWLKKGPTGTIATSVNDAKDTVQAILSDLDNADETMDTVDNSDVEYDPINSIPALQKSSVINWKQFKKIDEFEVNSGQMLSPHKPREKIVDRHTMIKIAG